MAKKKKKMPKKGFTLIELLAVILILGIIALIAIPQVTNVIENAHKGSAEVSAKHYLDAVNNTVSLNKLDQNSSNDYEGTYNVGDIPVQISGEAPESGTITITNGVVTAATLVVSGYNVTYDPSTGKCEATKGDANSTRYVYYSELGPSAMEDEDLTSDYKGQRPADSVVYLKYPVKEGNKAGKPELCYYNNGEFCINDQDSFSTTKAAIIAKFGQSVCTTATSTIIECTTDTVHVQAEERDYNYVRMDDESTGLFCSIGVYPECDQ